MFILFSTVLQFSLGLIATSYVARLDRLLGKAARWSFGFECQSFEKNCEEWFARKHFCGIQWTCSSLLLFFIYLNWCTIATWKCGSLIYIFVIELFSACFWDFLPRLISKYLLCNKERIHSVNLFQIFTCVNFLQFLRVNLISFSTWTVIYIMNLLWIIYWIFPPLIVLFWLPL